MTTILLHGSILLAFHRSSFGTKVRVGERKKAEVIFHIPFAQTSSMGGMVSVHESHGDVSREDQFMRTRFST